VTVLSQIKPILSDLELFTSLEFIEDWEQKINILAREKEPRSSLQTKDIKIRKFVEHSSEKRKIFKIQNRSRESKK
jgi:hypothetical protein